jgi:hypothetical protein
MAKFKQKYFIDKQFLIDRYIKQNKNAKEIAKEVGCTPPVIFRNLQKYSIPLKNLSEIRLKIKPTKDYLIEEYVNKQRSCTDIAKEFNCCSTSIGNKLKKYGIQARITDNFKHTPLALAKIKEARARQTGENHPRLGTHMSEESKLKRLKTLSIRGISFKGKNNPRFGKKVSEETKEKTRKIFKEHRVSMMENNPNWKGGIMFLPYTKEFNKVFKEKIRIREGYKCLNCGLSNDDCKKKYKQILHIHHVDYDKLNTTPENCCAVCCGCNIKANYDRDKWKIYYQTLLSNKYGYKYLMEDKNV